MQVARAVGMTSAPFLPQESRENWCTEAQTGAPQASLEEWDGGAVPGQHPSGIASRAFIQSAASS
jgi:hypothetical protein